MIPPAIDAAQTILDRHLDPASPTPLVVGFSGGSDSLALLLCARAWGRRCGRPLLALTVDHQLHPDSADWTARAGATAHELGVPWRALTWVGPRPCSGLPAGLPAAARRARHALLAEAARAAGAGVLMLGHTGDDIAESELIRLDTPTHGRLAAWSPSPIWPEGRGVFLLRPLLALHRDDLRSWLTGQKFCWLDDPANADPRFARSRARAALAQAARTIAAPARAIPLRRARPSGPAGDLIGLDVCGALDLDTQSLFGIPAPLDHLARALVCVSGRERPPQRLAVARLLARIKAGAGFKATLAGARILFDGQGLHLAREIGRTPAPPIPLAVGANVVFDGRFELAARAPGWRVHALAGHAALLSKADRSALQTLRAPSRPSLPVLLGPAGQVQLPAPLGGGPAFARGLVGERLTAALGLIAGERDLSSAASTQDLS